MSDKVKPGMEEMLNLEEIFADWVTRGWLRQVDVALARFLLSAAKGQADISAEGRAALALATVLVSHQLGRGHVCLDLEATLGDPGGALSLPPEDDFSPRIVAALPPIMPQHLIAGWTLETWIAALKACPRLVADGSEALFPSRDAGGEGMSRQITQETWQDTTPLVLVGHRLYLRRYFRYERQVETAIRRRLDRLLPLDESLFRHALAALFPDHKQGDGPDWQKIACAMAARSAFSVITGGPGTGKTTTVVRLLALLQSMALGKNTGRPLQIRLAAPTGKAAARLRESIASAIDKLPAFVQNHAGLKASIPNEVTTLHRLLGSRPDSRRFRHDDRHPLPLDVLVIDEASMVDLEMMAAVLQALPPHARLILLGDKDQLASVEAGAVLGALCRRAEGGHFLPATREWITRLTGETLANELEDPQGTALDQHVSMLRWSYRFDGHSGIGQLARAVNAGDRTAMQSVWSRRHADLFRLDLDSLDGPAWEGLVLGERETGDALGLARLFRAITEERPDLEADKADFDVWAGRVLKLQSDFQLLCALRHGPYGVNGMNQRIESLLRRKGLIDPSSMWYAGRPVLVTRNSYSLGLMNGDIGLTLPYPMPHREPAEKRAGQNGEFDEFVWGLRVAFADGAGGIRWILPSRLASVETVYALTVHKSQGSEFTHCALLLPETLNPVLTRELLYTGITRARSRFTLICPAKGVDELAAEKRVQRSSGLFLEVMEPAG